MADSDGNHAFIVAEPMNPTLLISIMISAGVSSAGGQVVLQNPGPTVAQLLETTGLMARFSVELN